ncbi:orotate phosphoribosyltransferase [Martelella endophytica]|uniref:Orotate phosphoribosyltransferase n=1 Tax=Martelella endophytica TaxID=1486262 RepID=A0A0D5LVJ7_MAREN|nr:orotate phosphoribosyltransferase [Martelella endophytica]AJY47970.1 orotate phosphoribosyltransferase [Martelella endophytica]
MTRASFADPAVMGELMARMLWEIEAVHFAPDEPYKLSSGLVSPVYIDCRKLLSYPRVRSTLMDFAAATVLKQAGFERFDCVAGGETAGIPFAALLADRLELPMIYVRKKPKGYGRNAQIEGTLPKGARVLMVEDLTTAGGSMFHFINAVREAGGVVEHGLALFYYDIFEQAEKRFTEGGVDLHYIATWKEVLAVAREEQRSDPKTLDSVAEFLDRPMEWSRARGGLEELLV